jgi:hypothetical protein
MATGENYAGGLAEADLPSDQEADPADPASENEDVVYEDDEQYDKDGALEGRYQEDTEAIEYEQHELPETPDNPIIYSRFVFLSDQKHVPNDMKKLEERAMRRRHDFLARMQSSSP